MKNGLESRALAETVREACNYPDGFGELLHVFFRKFSDSPESSAMWKAINDLPDGEWQAALKFAFEHTVGELDIDEIIREVSNVV